MDMDHDEQQPDQRREPHVVQIVTTEHYNLQAARSLATSDANGRAALFLGTVSGTLIALAFVGNVSHVGTRLGTAFFVFAFVLFPALVFLGLATFDSVLQSDIEAAIQARGIYRIRQLYRELAPQVYEYLILPEHGEATGFFRRAHWWQGFLTLAGIVAVINAILAGVFVGLVVAQLGAPALVLCVAAGVTLFLALLVAQLRYQYVQWRAARLQLEGQSPAPGSTAPVAG
jgi:hypothetical protein